MLPAPMEEPLEESLLLGSYDVNIRLMEPTTTRARKALVERRSAQATGMGTAGVVFEPVLPGSL